MTSLADLSALGGGGDQEKNPTFTFKRVGDKVRGQVVRSNVVDVRQDDGTTRQKLVIDLVVDKARGGRVVKDADGIVTGVEDIEAGTTVTVWLNKGYGIGAISDAVRKAGESKLADGGIVTIEHTEKRDVGRAMPANIFAATYEPPVGGTDLDDF
jgi:hypothetical protein